MRKRPSASARITAWITALSIALAPAAVFAEPTAAEKETARSLMKEGRARRDKGEHKAALDAFQGADNIMKVPTTGLEVGRSQTDLKQLVEARDTFLRIARMPEEPGEPAAFKEARKEAMALAAKLEERIPTVKLVLSNLPKGVKPTVAIDDAPVSAAMLPYPVKVNPGTHAIVATIGSFKKSADVELIEGANKEVPLDMTGAPADDGSAKPLAEPEPQPKSPGDSAPTPGKTGTSSLVYAGFAVAGVGIVLGSVTGLLAMSKTNAAKEDCDGTRCPPSTHDDLASARTMATVSTVSFVVGLVGVGVGVYGLFGSSSSSEPPKAALGPVRKLEPFIGLGTFGVTGAFRSSFARSPDSRDTRWAVSIPPDKPSPLVPGYRLDRYELLCPLAQGGMASVWVARQIGKHGFEKLIALKTILPQFSSDHRFRRMFLDEAHIAAGIEHPNVAQILDLGEQHDVLYIAMEWVDGDALSRLSRAVEKKNLAIPPAILLRILADACGGLHAAHELRGKDGGLLGVVHRDVSPQNILVSTKGVAKIIDFGVAKARDRVAEDTNAGVLKGKIQYMAPEQAVGKPIDRRADVWAMGAILYHMLAGKPPFDAPNQLAVLHRLSSGKPPLPLPQSIPRPVSDIVRATLTFDASKRIATAQDLQTAIEDAMQKAGLRASTADVASYLREHLADRSELRKKAVEVALQAAAERARVAQVLSMPSSDSASGVNDPRLKSPPEIGSLSELASPKSEPPTTHGVAASNSSAAIAVPAPAALPLAGRGKLVAVAAVAFLVLGMVIAFTTRPKPQTPVPMPTPAAAPTPSAAPTPIGTASAEPTNAASAAPTPSTPPTPTVVANKSVTAPKVTTTAAAASATQKPKGWKKIDDGF